MLGKVLGMVTAGVFIGAAAVEISGYLARDRAGKRPLPPQATDQDAGAAKTHGQAAPRVEG